MSSLVEKVSEIKPPKSRKKYEKRSLIAKLAEVFRQIEMVEKKGQTQSYEYLRACDVYRATRGLLMERNVLIFPNVLSEEWAHVDVPQESGELKRLRQCTVKCRFVFEDGDSGETRPCEGIGASVGDHTALAAAITGAEKSMLKGLGMIIDEEADPEYDAAAHEPKIFLGKIHDMRKTCLTVIPSEGEPIKIKVEDEATRNRLFQNRGQDVRAECLMQVNKYGKQWWQLRDVLIGKFQVAIANQPDLGAVLEASAEQAALIKTMRNMAAQGEISEPRLLEHIATTYSVSDVKQLTPKELTEIIDWIFANGKKGPQPVASILDGEPDEIEQSGD